MTVFINSKSSLNSVFFFVLYLFLDLTIFVEKLMPPLSSMEFAKSCSGLLKGF
jgi:hypothetical protein